MTGLSTAQIHRVAFHECAHAVIAVVLGAPVKRLWMARQAVDGRFGGCVGRPVRIQPSNLVYIALAGCVTQSLFAGEPVERLLRRSTVDRRAAHAALARCDEDLTIEEALHDCRRLCLSWWPEITQLVPHLLVSPTGELSSRQIEAILEPVEGR